MASRRGKTTGGQDTPGGQEATDAEAAAPAGASRDAAGAKRPTRQAEAPEPAENMFAEEAPRDQAAAGRPLTEVEGAPGADPDAVTPGHPADTIAEEKPAEPEPPVEAAAAFPEVEGASVVDPDAVTPRHPADTIDEEKLVELAEAETHVETVDDPARRAEPGPADETAQSRPSPQTTQAPVAPQAPPEPRRSGGVLAPLLGGVLAAALGYGLAIYGWTQNLALPFLPQADGGAGAELSELRAGMSAEAEARAAQIAALQADLEALRDAPAGATDTAALDARLAAIEAQLADAAPDGPVDAEALAALGDRIAALEARPAAGDAAAEAADVAALRETLAAVEDEVARLAADAAAATEAAQAAAAEAEAELAARSAEAEEAARRATAQAALAQLFAALESGAPLDPALGAVGAAGIDVPAALDEARAGVPSLAELQARFPDAARAALAATHGAEAPEDPLERIGGFLRAQVGLRSLSPREGDDADAILSRAEAALRAGDLATAVAEVDTLPEAAQPAMAGWQADARARLAAVGAAETLAADIDPQ